MRKETAKYKNDVFTVWPLMSYADCMFCNTQFMWEIGYGWQASNRHCSYSCSSCSNSLKDFDAKVSVWLENSTPKIAPKAPPPVRSKS